MRTPLLVLLLALASGAGAQTTDPRLHGAWHAPIEDPGSQAAGTMWLEFDASGRMFGQMRMVKPPTGEVEEASMEMTYTVEGDRITADGSPAAYSFADGDSLRIVDGAFAVTLSRPGAPIRGLDVLGLWEVVGEASVVRFATDRQGPPAVYVYSPQDAASEEGRRETGVWRVSAGGLSVETDARAAVVYTAIEREGEQVTLAAASGERLVLRPLADPEGLYAAPSRFRVPLSEEVDPVPPPRPPAPPRSDDR